MSHTPTPWVIKRSLEPVSGQWDYAISSEANPGVIAECFGRIAQDRIEDAGANAAFIVRACNSHDDLVRALENLLAQTDPFRPGRDTEAELDARKQAVAALSRAKGSQP